MNGINNKYFVKGLLKYLTISVVLLCAGVVGSWLQNVGAFLPQWIVWEHGTFQDGSEQYEIILAGKKVRVQYGEDIIWTTEKDVKVQKALSADIDRDEQDELILLCWRKGHYGDVKPIWVEEDEQDWVQHIFVYEFLQEDVQAKWMSSYIGKDILDITARDLETTGRLLCLKDRSGEESVWTWDSWGFVRVDID